MNSSEVRDIEVLDTLVVECVAPVIDDITDEEVDILAAEHDARQLYSGGMHD